MAINPETQYPGKINPSDADYPYGSARNITLPGDGTGTPWEAALVNDIFGFQQALLQAAAIAPSGSPEKATLSQYLQALQALFSPISLTQAGGASKIPNAGVQVDTVANFQAAAWVVSGLNGLRVTTYDPTVRHWRVTNTETDTTIPLQNSMHAEELEIEQANTNRDKTGRNVTLSRVEYGGLSLNGEPSVSILGDSITYGVGSGDIFNDSWAGVLTKMLLGEYGGANIGFLPAIQSSDTPIHTVTTIGTWTGLSLADASHTMNGYARSSTDGAAQLNIVVPAELTQFFDVWWTRQPGGGTFDIFVNGVNQTTVDTDGGSSKSGWFRSASLPMNDDGTGVVNISLRPNGDGPIEICGVAYNNNTDEYRLQTWAHPGRRAQFVDDAVITNAANGAKTLIWALGHNDQNATGGDLTTVLSKLDTVLSTCQANNTKLVVCDFIWDKTYSNAVKAKLKEIGEAPGSSYIEFSRFFNTDSSVPTSSELITRGFLVDSSHPSPDGHQTISETIANTLGLSVSGKLQAAAQRIWDFENLIKFTPTISNADLLGSDAFYEVRDGYVDLVIKVRVENVTADVVLNIPAPAAPAASYYTSGGLEAQLLPATVVAISATGVTPQACQFTTASTLRVRNTSALNNNSDVHVTLRYKAA